MARNSGGAQTGARGRACVGRRPADGRPAVERGWQPNLNFLGRLRHEAILVVLVVPDYRERLSDKLVPHSHEGKASALAIGPQPSVQLLAGCVTPYG